MNFPTIPTCNLLPLDECDSAAAAAFPPHHFIQLLSMHSTTFQRIQDIRCIPLSAPRTCRALLSCLSWWCAQFSGRTGASADLRSRSPFPPDVTFGPAPSLRVRILLQLHQPISSKSPHLFYSCYCTQDLHQNLGTVQYTIEEQKKTTHIA